MATAARPHLSAGYVALAINLQEASQALSANDVRTRLQDSISDCYRGSGTWAYLIDYFGDAESGDVIYSCDGECMKAPYAITSEGGAAKCVIDTEQAVDVVPRTVYEEEADEGDHYAAMEESFKRDGLYQSLPLYERFISKKERDAASSDDFAGSGRSFPILKPEDVTAAARSIGRAGGKNKGPNAIKAAIIRIAKRKGWEKYLPKAWRGGDSSATESATLVRDHETIKLTEGAATTEAIVLREARADYEIKLIAPGKGSSAFYPAEVLKRDGPQVFRAGTHVYLNHPTAAEEAARPEGDVANLAGVLTTDATYHESHAKGPGLYGRMKVFADHATMVEEKAPHVGMSIRASGDAVVEGKRPVMRDGVPVLARLTSAESVDVVTRAGAGGMILTEAARSAESHQEVSVDQTALEKLQQQVALQEAANKRLLERALRADAREEAARLLETVSLPAQAKLKIIETCVRDVPVTAEGTLDTAKFKESVDAETKSMGAFLASIGGGGQVRGLGDSGPVETDPAKLREAQERQAADEKLALAEAEGVFARLMGDKTAAKNAALKGVAA